MGRHKNMSPYTNNRVNSNNAQHVCQFQGLYSLTRRCLTGIGIPIINLRRSDARLRFIMGIPILISRRLLSVEAQGHYFDVT